MSHLESEVHPGGIPTRYTGLPLSPVGQRRTGTLGRLSGELLERLLVFPSHFRLGLFSGR